MEYSRGIKSLNISVFKLEENTEDYMYKWGFEVTSYQSHQSSIKIWNFCL